MEEMPEVNMHMGQEHGHKIASTVKETFQINGSPIELSVYDFRNEKTAGPIRRLNIYFDGVGQYEDSPIKDAMLEKAQKENAVLVCPRMPKLIFPKESSADNQPKPDSALEAKYILEALESKSFAHKIAEQNLRLNFSDLNSLSLYGFSEGARNAQNFAYEYEKNYPKKEGEERNLELWGLIGSLHISDNPNGKTVFNLFCKELFDITAEEMRLRLNNEISLKPERFKELGIQPLRANSLPGEILTSINRLFESTFGTAIFSRNFKDAWGKNISLIPPIIKRLLTGPKGNFYPALARNEVRSEASDKLSTFDLTLKIPNADILTPPESLGNQVIAFLEKQSDQYRSELLKIIPQTLHNYPLGLGVWLLSGTNTETPEQAETRIKLIGQSFFPKSKNIRTAIIGRSDSGSISHQPEANQPLHTILRESPTVIRKHLGPLANPWAYLKA